MDNSLLNSGKLIEFITKNDSFYSCDRLRERSITQLVIIKTEIEVEMANDLKNKDDYQMLSQGN